MFDEFLQGLNQYYEDSRWDHAGGKNSNTVLHITVIQPMSITYFPIKHLGEAITFPFPP